MEKNKINYKLINIALITLIIFLIYRTGNLWLGLTDKFIMIITPFIFAFAASYAIYPFLEKLQKKLPKSISIAIIVMAILLILSGVIYIVATLLVGQLSSLFDSIISFFGKIGDMNFDINVSSIETSLKDIFKEIMTSLGEYVSNGTINLIGNSMALLSRLFIGFAAFVYFLIDMEKIRHEVKEFLKKRTDKLYRYVVELDNQMRRYLTGLLKVMVISVFEYMLAYSIIGHPNAILLGLLAGIANLIPYFGGIGNNIIATITAFVVSPAMFIKTIIVFTIMSSVDGYLINPMIYGKTNSIHPLIVILSIFAGGIIFGIPGIIISFPCAIIAVTTYKFFKDDISHSVKKNIKRNN